MNRRPSAQSGLTILEMVIALGIGGIVVMVLASLADQMFDMKAHVRQYDALSSLEQKIREAARDRYSLLTLTKARNPGLANCVDNLDPVCRNRWQPLNLIYLRGQPLDGTYTELGQRCPNDRVCPIRVETLFQASCLQSPCQAVNSIYINYAIAHQGVRKRNGTLTFVNTEMANAGSDSGDSCLSDSSKRPTFVRRIVDGRVVTTQCQEVLQAVVTMKGIKPGACKRGTNPEVLVGVLPGGDLICEPVRFKP